MSTIVDAIFEGGSFKPQQATELGFADGQRVKLTIEVDSSVAVPQPEIENRIESLSLLSRQQFQHLLINQSPPWMSANLADHLKRIMEDDDTRFPHLSATGEPLSLKILNQVNEGLEFMTGPRVVTDAIRQQFKQVIDTVRDIRPAEPKNKIQRFTRTTLAAFSNASSFFIYVVLIAAALKVLLLFGAHNSRLVQAIDNAKYTMMPLFLIVVLLCLLAVRALHRISSFVRSYRVMSILGCAIAIKFLSRRQSFF